MPHETEIKRWKSESKEKIKKGMHSRWKADREK